MLQKTFKFYRRICRSCLAFFYTEHKHSKVCGECKLRTKHMRDIRILKAKQKREIEDYIKKSKTKII